MKNEFPPFFLFLGESDREGATSKLKAAGLEYKKKRLESSLENWDSIFDLLRAENLSGVLAKLNNTTYELMARAEYAEATERLFSTLEHLPHIIFVHESFFTGVSDRAPPDATEDDLYFWTASYFEPPEPRVVKHIHTLMDRYEINFVPYRKNAELTVMASAFIDQNEKNLIFRLYVPNGRMWAKEAENLLQLFSDYLRKVSGLRVRQDQYTTNKGVVYEFFGDHILDPATLPKEFDEFSKLLDMCITSPRDATEMLVGRSVDSQSVHEIVERYAKEAKRLHIDLKHERERSVLSIRHRMESELVDVVGAQTDWDELNRLVDLAVPRVDGVSTAIGFGTPSPVAISSGGLTINVRPQIISSVQGIVAQEVSGTQNFGTEANQLIALVKRYGGSRATELTSAVYEVEDADANQADRLSARQKLKTFLYKTAEKTGDVALGILQSYIEKKLGI
ncbi:hypothetical protein [Burkholderia cepacia]|uniref:hypothetical protein n=1 Tax=Burkholderia cepacia TaxID=292 RepID=UPI000A778A5E|nr:hypothetical protein [Burkholderia cepacia]EMD9440939.1 hypothetical protein [Burkholderia cepacia]NHB05364.1 hypothetical protein [Burkholderia cepacia]